MSESRYTIFSYCICSHNRSLVNCAHMAGDGTVIQGLGMVATS